jgi:hypothetical protein
MKIDNFKPNGHDMGYVATFDVVLDCGVLLREFSLMRPSQAPGASWLVIPNLERDNRRAFFVPHDLRTKIGQRATAAFTAVTGIELEYAPPPKAAEAKPAIAGWLDRHEDDNAGLKRVLAA